MRPNTPYGVYNDTNAIYHGGHFIASATMKDTLSGIVDGFMSNSYAKDTCPQQTKHLIRRIVIFYHMALVRNMIEPDSMFSTGFGCSASKS